MSHRKLILALAGLWLGASVAMAQSLPASGMGQAGEEHPWSQAQANAARTGQSPAVGPTLGQVQFKYLIPQRAPGLAVARDGSVNTGDIFNDAAWSGEDYVSLLTSSGDLRWRTKIPSYPWGMAQGTASRPAFDRAGNAIVQGSAGMLHKIDRSGKILWTHTGRDDVTNDASPAVLADGSIRAYQFGMYALAADGTLLWENGGGGGTPAVSFNGEMATGAGKSNEPHGFPSVYYLNANGTLRWVVKTTYGGGSLPVFGPDGTLYIVVDGQGFTAYDPWGRVLWINATGSWAQGPALGKNGQLYLPFGSTLSAVNKQTGDTLWTTQLAGSLVGLAIDARDFIYATTSNGDLCAVRPDGTILWQRSICDAFVTGPAIGAEGQALASGSEGFESFIYSIE
ncbi:MAG: PQQ-binding-like beta-propeller repeat protein [Planctomycetota bacterium]